MSSAKQKLFLLYKKVSNLLSNFVATNKRTAYAFVFIFIYSATVAFAVPPGTKYNPGETLDPNCAPGDTNCSVLISGGGAVTGSNGITVSGSDVRLGGELTGDTTIELDSNERFTLHSDDGTNTVSLIIGNLFPDGFYLESDDGIRNSSFSSNPYASTFQTYDNNLDYYTSISSGDVVYLESRNLANSIYSNLQMNKESFTISGSPTFPGVVYSDDYSVNYTDRSLVDKQYVDSLASGAPIDPLDTGSTALDVGTNAMFASGRYVYTLSIDENSLQITDVSNPTNPEVVATSNTISGHGNGVYVAGRYAYVITSSPHAIKIYDISNPSDPIAMGSTTIGAFPNSIYVAGRYAYVVGGTSGRIEIVDISNPSVPRSIATLSITGVPRSVYVSGAYAYVTTSSNALRVINISDPNNPTLESSVATGTSPQTVRVSGRYAYVINQTSSTLQTFDISNPTSVTNVGSTGTDAGPNSMDVAGRYAYVVSAGDQIQVFDLNDPTAPVEVASSGINSQSVGVYTIGRYAYVANDSELQVFDIGRIEFNSAIVNSLETGNLQTKNDIVAQGNIIATGGITSGTSGIYSAGFISTSAGIASSIAGDGSSTVTALKLERFTTDTPTDGLGVDMSFYLQNVSNISVEASKIRTVWQNAVSSIPETIFSTNNGSPQDIFKYDSDGIKYISDFSASYTNRSLVDKEYVDNSGLVGSTTSLGTETWLGSNAGYGPASTNNTVFIGINAGINATSASHSNFIGSNAGTGGVNANGSNFSGQSAGGNATNASYSNFFGETAGSNATNANDSNFFGYRAGIGATNASYSTIIGHESGATFTSNNIGSNNIIIGTHISLPDATANAINIGGVLFGTGTYNSINGNPSIVGNSGGRIGILTNSPSATLHVKSSGTTTNELFRLDDSASTNRFLVLDNGTTTFTPNVTTTSGLTITTSALTTGKLMDLQVSGTAAGASQTALNILTTGANGTGGITTYGAQISNTHSTNTSTNVALYLNASGGATANYGLIVNAGNVGLGNTAPGFQLHVGSSAVTDGTTLIRLQDSNSTCDFNANTGSPTCGSDLTLKKDVESLDVTSLLSKVSALNPVSYRWLTDDSSANLQYGFIAQEVAEQFPNLVTENTWIDGTTRKFLNMGGLMPYVVGAVKELNLEITSISDLNTENIIRDNIVAWLSNASNKITRIFTGEVCITEAGQEPVCLNRGELVQLKGLLNNAPVSSTPPSEDNNIPPEEESGNTEENPTEPII